MADDIKRLNYFDHQFLREKDFNDEQAYHLRLQRDHARLMHTPGIAEGLEVPDPPTGSKTVTVRKGIAYDREGRRLVLAEDTEIELGHLGETATAVYLAIAYDETPTDPSDEGGIEGDTRWAETPRIEVLETPPNENESTALVLARIAWHGGAVGNIKRDERKLAGVLASDLEVRRLVLASDRIDSGSWVQAKLGEASQADLYGSLIVNGDLSVTGSITGNIPLPIASIDGVSHPGGDVDLHSSGAIQIQPEKEEHRIMIGENHSPRTDNPHGTTAEQVGALSTAGGELSGNLEIKGTLGIGTSSPASSEEHRSLRGLLLDVHGVGDGEKKGIECYVKDGEGFKRGIYTSITGGGIKTAGEFLASTSTPGWPTKGLDVFAQGQAAKIYSIHCKAHGSGRSEIYGIRSEITSDGSSTKAYAGWFQGNVHVLGTLSKTNGAFLIDHPVDPYNQTLRHSFVESPEELCLYRGKLLLDDTGRGVVEVPSYFPALTAEHEATVTLTAIGRQPFAASYEWNADFTAFDVYGNPNAEVSYQVLARRDDPAIHILRRPVEEEKQGSDRGKLLFPAAYGEKDDTGPNLEDDEESL